MSANCQRAALAPITALVVILGGALIGCGPSEPKPGTDGASEPEPTQLGSGYAGEADMPSHPVLTIPEESPKVLFLGDSITAGLHLPVDQAWPASLQRSLFADDHPFHLQNAGVSGDTSAGGLQRMDWLLKGNPDIIVIELGANDGLRNTALSATENNLRAIIKKVEEAGAKPILMGMDVPTHLGDYAKDFSAIYPRLAKEFDIPFVPSFFEGVGGHAEMNLPIDGMHPTPAGHDRLAENVKSALRDVLVGLGNSDG